jgi:replicative DNA helicase
MSAYEFDDDFQAKIAALVLRDPTFNVKTLGLVEPRFLNSSIDAALVNVGLAYYRTYKRCPTLPILGKLVKTLFDKKVLRDDLREETKERIGRLLKEDLGDRDYIIDEVATFAKHQALIEAIEKSIGFLEKREFDKIDSAIKTAQLVGVTQDLGEYDYFAEAANRTHIRRQRLAGLLPPTGISTGYHAIDELLKHKGWGRKELSLLMGGAKAGKSFGLLEFAKTAALQRINTLYITLENSNEVTADRLDANLADTNSKELELNAIDVESKVNAIAPSAGKLIIREIAGNKCKPSDIRRLLEHYRAKSIVFEMLVVDYLDIMAPDIRTGDSIQDNKSVYVDVRSIAQEENLAALSATQTNREGFKAAVARADHVAEDFNKIRIADITISINRTDEEKTLGEARLFFASGRNQEDGFTLRIKQDLAKGKFLSRVIGRE